MAEYELFLIKDMSELKEGEEQIVNVRSTDTMETRTVRAILSSSPEKLPGGDKLTIFWQRGYKHPQPWVIKVIEDLGTLTETITKEYL